MGENGRRRRVRMNPKELEEKNRSKDEQTRLAHTGGQRWLGRKRSWRYGDGRVGKAVRCQEMSTCPPWRRHECKKGDMAKVRLKEPRGLARECLALRDLLRNIWVAIQTDLRMGV